NRTEAIIQSMTPAERRDVDLLNNSRRRRIARGSGSDQKAVSQLVRGFEMVSQMSKQMSGMGMLSKMKAMRGMDPAAMSAAMASRGGGLSLRGGGKEKPKYKQRKKRR